MQLRDPARADVATLVIGRWGNVEDADAGACALFGYAKLDLLQLRGSDLIAPEDRPEVGVAIDRMRLGEVDYRRGRIVRNGGASVPVDVRARPLPLGRVELTLRPVDGGRTAAS